MLELLVVVAMLALLAALVAPALAYAKNRSKTSGCLNNLRQTAVAWKVYSDENRGTLAANKPQADDQTTWINGTISAHSATNASLITSGTLYPLLQTLNPFHCPADATFYDGIPTVLSYSMNGWMGSRVMLQDGAGGNNAAYRTFMRETEINTIGATSRLWVMTDEDASTLDDGWFAVGMDDRHPFASFPGRRHANGGGVNFADGHAEIFKLRDPATLPGNHAISATNSDWLLWKQMTSEQ